MRKDGLLNQTQEKRKISEIFYKVKNKYNNTSLPFYYDYNGWTLHPEVLRFLLAFVAEACPKKVVEFGSGVSTVSIAKELRAAQRIISFEHNHKFSEKNRKMLIDYGLKNAEIKTRPLCLRIYHKKILGFYKTTKKDANELEGADFVLVDGPPGRVGREASLYLMYPLMNDGAVLILDDSNRRGEQRAILAWKKKYGTSIKIKQMPHIGKGICLVQKWEATPKGENFRVKECLYSSLRSLRGILKEKRRVIR